MLASILGSLGFQGLGRRLASRRGSPGCWDHALRAFKLQPWIFCLRPCASIPGVSPGAGLLMPAGCFSAQGTTGGGGRGVVLAFLLCTKTSKGLINWQKAVKIILSDFLILCLLPLSVSFQTNNSGTLYWVLVSRFVVWCQNQGNTPICRIFKNNNKINNPV